MKFKKTKLLVLGSALVLSLVGPIAADTNTCPNSSVGHNITSYEYLFDTINQHHSSQQGPCTITTKYYWRETYCMSCKEILNRGFSRSEVYHTYNH